jgi:hypothetical protein
MTDYTKLVAAVRDTDFGDTCVYCEHSDMCKDADCIILQAADAIERLTMLYEKAEMDATNFTGELAQAHADIDKLKSQMPKRGEWKHIFGGYVECSICGASPLLDGEREYVETNYCPNCGAKMEVQDEGA